LARGCEELEMLLGKETYGDVKEGQLLVHRRRVKDAVRSEALKGWVRNTGDDSFGLV
jgi:tRNA-specific adenosine deaminase 1